MQTITLTASEIKTLETYLWCNPCNSGCVCSYKGRIHCDTLDANGKHRCELLRNTDSILAKIEGRKT